MDWELIIATIIIAFMLYLAFSGGRKNPVTTRQLEQRAGEGERKFYDELHKVKNEMQALEGRFAASATKADIAALRTEITDAATERTNRATRELGKIRDQVTAVCTKVEGLEKSADRTFEGVQRIEKFFLEKGIKG